MKQTFRRFACCLLLCTVLAGSFPVASFAAFADVPAGHWAEEEISHCATLGVFGGISADQFGLGQSMTRSAFAVVLCRFFGWDTSAPRQIYPDVPIDAWYAGAVTAAYDHGAFTLQRPTFRPRDAITREELAVALIRALGYTSLSGRAQELGHPFTDVTTNAGYITLSYDLGLLGGTSATTFSPSRTATREQVAVIFSRLHRKLHGGTASTVAILPADRVLPDALPCQMVAVGGARLASSGLQFSSVDQKAAESTLEAIHLAGAEGLLYVQGRQTALRTTPASAAQQLAKTVETSGFDGLFLDITGLTAAHRTDMTALVQALDAALGDRPLYLMADALPWGVTAGAYDYAALSAAADRIVLRIAPYAEKNGSTMVAPVEPPEEIYYTLRTLKDSVDSEKLSLLLTTTGSAWIRTSQQGPMVAEDISSLLEDGAVRHSSARYACAYLTRGTSTVWYLDGQSVDARQQLCRLLGVWQVCLSDASSLLPEVAAALS